jgi:hypothetical protein
MEKLACGLCGEGIVCWHPLPQSLRDSSFGEGAVNAFLSEEGGATRRKEFHHAAAKPPVIFSDT